MINFILIILQAGSYILPTLKTTDIKFYTLICMQSGLYAKWHIQADLWKSNNQENS